MDSWEQPDEPEAPDLSAEAPDVEPLTAGAEAAAAYDMGNLNETLNQSEESITWESLHERPPTPPDVEDETEIKGPKGRWKLVAGAVAAGGAAGLGIAALARRLKNSDEDPEDVVQDSRRMFNEASRKSLEHSDSAMDVAGNFDFTQAQGAVQTQTAATTTQTAAAAQQAATNAQ